MTTRTDLRSGPSGKSRQPQTKQQGRSPRSTDIRMNMPERAPQGPERGAAPTGDQSQENIERMLLKLIGRLDENDRHYGQALDSLNGRLNTISQRAQSASTSGPAGSAAALDRVREQASSLAEQVNDAGVAHRAQQSAPVRDLEQRLSTFSPPQEGSPHPGTSIPVNDDFADVTERLERSLAAGAPANEFESLNSRMDELARHLDTALESRNDPTTLQSIETRLDELAHSFTNAQQQYSRIEDIEGHLLSLMSWAQSASVPANDDAMYTRLDAIERTLQALNDNARELGERPGGTYEPQNEAANSPEFHHQPPGGYDAPGEEPRIAAEETHPPQADGEGFETGDYDDVRINETQAPYAAPEPQTAPPGRTPVSDALGASIPDFQPGPETPQESPEPAPPGENTLHRAPLQDRIEPGFEEDNDFIASARRAAAAAAAHAPEASRAGRKSFSADAPAKSRIKNPRPLFIAAAVGLLLVSAGFLFGQLRDKPEAPALAPKAPVSGNNQRSSLPASGTAAEKQHSGRMMPGQRQPDPAKPAAPVAAAPVAAAPVALATPANYRAPAPARAPLPATRTGRTISTATILASLPPETSPGPLPGVQVTIKEPVVHTPALVPSAIASRPNPLALPKRAPAPAAANTRSTTASLPSDSAPARRVSQPMPSRAVPMPPVRIGPQSLRVAAARGNPMAQVEVASRFAKGTGVTKNLKKAAEWYDRAAAQGFAPAQYRLAALFERGLGVKQDISLAKSWYRRAAELGNVRAMHNLAVLQTRAKSGSPDYTGAKNWFHQAARHGLADSQFNLGVLYESGLGVTKNAAEAYKWFTLAAHQGDDEARKRREAIRPQLPAKSLNAVEQTLKRWKAITPNEAANKTGRPRGGWHTAKLTKTGSASSTASVAQAQKLLNKLGYDAGVPDGRLGPQTIAAIRKFENRTGAQVSGKVTPKLLQQLSALNG